MTINLCLSMLHATREKQKTTNESAWMDALRPQLYLYKSLQGLKEVIFFIYNIINFF